MSVSLSNSQRKFLRRLAHGAPATVQLGKHGLTPNFYKNLETALLSHELLKLRFSNLEEERKELSAEIEAQTGATLVSMVGYTAIYFRENPDPEKRRVILPKPGRASAQQLSHGAE